MNKKAYSILSYIIAYKRDNDGVAPTIRAICAACGIASTSNVQQYLIDLELEGYIKRIGEPGQGRNITVTGGEWRYRSDLAE